MHIFRRRCRLLLLLLFIILIAWRPRTKRVPETRKRARVLFRVLYVVQLVGWSCWFHPVTPHNRTTTPQYRTAQTWEG